MTVGCNIVISSVSWPDSEEAADSATVGVQAFTRASLLVLYLIVYCFVVRRCPVRSRPCGNLRCLAAAHCCHFAVIHLDTAFL